MLHALDDSYATTGHPDPDVAGIGRLVDMLAGVADPRQARGVRHRIGTVLTVMVLAVLASVRNFREIADRAAELPPQVLALAGCRVHRVTGVHVTPGKATVGRIAHAIDADAADEQISAWIRAEAMAAANPDRQTPEGLIAVAMDGKTVRNTCPSGTEGTEIKLFSALTHADAVVIAGGTHPAGHQRDHSGDLWVPRTRAPSLTWAFCPSLLCT